MIARNIGQKKPSSTCDSADTVNASTGACATVATLTEIVTARMAELRWSETDLAQAICRKLHRPYYPGYSGFVGNIRRGKRAVPVDQVRHWASALGWLPGSAQAKELEAAAEMHSAKRQQRAKPTLARVEALFAQLDQCEAENQRLTSEVTRLTAELTSRNRAADAR